MDEKDCRIEATVAGNLKHYFRATHLPTGIVVEHSDDAAERYGEHGRSLLLAALRRAIQRANGNTTSTADA